MRLMYINNDGAGFADYIEVAPGTTVQALFAERVPHGKPHDFLIRVNRQPVAADLAPFQVASRGSSKERNSR